MVGEVKMDIEDLSDKDLIEEYEIVVRELQNRELMEYVNSNN